MPYEIRMQGGKHCVYNKDTGESKGCSDSHDMAVKHMRALYANAGGKALEGWLDIEDGSVKESVQATIDFLQVVEKSFDGTFEEAPVDAIHVNLDDGSSVTTSGMVQLGVREKSWWDNIIGTFRGVKPSSVMAYKQADGHVRVIMRVSNMFKDRHGEIITSEAHKEYVDWVDQDAENRMPEFWLWHTKGTRWGRADVLDFTDGFLITSGLVDVDHEDVAIKLAELGSDIGVSHGFYGASIQGKGFIDFYRSFEFSPLPRKEAANVWTAMMLAKEAELPISDTKRKFFIDELGMKEEYIARIEADNKDETAAIKAMGIQWKEDNGNAGESTGGDVSVSTPASPASTSEPTLSDVLAAVNQLGVRISVVEEKEKSVDVVAQAMEAALVAGKGIVPSQSKDNASNSEDAKAKNGDWFKDVVMAPAGLILPGGK